MERTIRTLSTSPSLLPRVKLLLSRRFSLSSSPQPTPDPPDLSPASVCGALSGYANDWRKALDFFNWAEQQCRFRHTTDTYNRMIDILGKVFEFDLSWSLIDRMRDDPLSFPDHVTFRIMFKRYVSAHLVDEASRTYDRLDEFGLKDETGYYNFVDALCEYKHVMEAHELCFGKDKKAELGFDVDDTKICNMILRGWFKMGWWSKCGEFWEEMDKKGIKKDLHSYSIYMDIECKRRKPWKAVKLYKEMKRKGIKLDVVAYNTVVRAVGLSEGVDFAIRLCREMRELGCEPNVVTNNTIIKLLCDNGRVRDAHKLLDEMRKGGCKPNVVTYNCLFGSLEKPREILRLFYRMIGTGVDPRMDTYVMLMRKFGRWGFLRPVLMLWNKMEELGASPDESAYNALIDALVDKGMIDMARRYDEEMLAKGLSPKPRVELAPKSEEGSR
ncbi:pentatricopeptide repeat-containing protein At1g80550, mitochondrial isoform X2 [Rhodamnia argentea]|uniref:Pentatricopeptide repeat-containing protein At1g80550, mitochondrial isoform X2 n=1 Tax=Rhodamnia argentea TaxID=178133 RepID=A0ABM3GZM2_9MYRT|nr:pentatricopeptide repeat-containing protein At1g80550, mitochondrial isoform X2 [Rhodamnia argentea]